MEIRPGTNEGRVGLFFLGNKIFQKTNYKTLRVLYRIKDE